MTRHRPASDHGTNLAYSLIPETVTEKNRFKGAGDLNGELKKAGVYSLVEQQYVTARLAIRNAAAHGHFDEYSADEVGELISGVREFVKSFPA